MKIPSQFLILGTICCSLLLISQSSGNEDKNNGKNEQRILPKEKATPGSSPENPIVLKGIKKYSQIKEKQQDYISKNYLDYRVVIEAFTMNADNRFIQFFTLENDEDELVRVYFDMTDVYKTLARSRDKETKERIKKLESWHMPREKSSDPEK